MKNISQSFAGMAALMLAFATPVVFAQEDAQTVRETTETTYTPDGETHQRTETITTTEEGRDRRGKYGLMVEPILALGQDNSTIDTATIAPITQDGSSRIESRGLGAKVGVHVYESVLVGLDARYSRSRFTDASLGSSEGNAFNYGPMVGVQTPFFGVRLMGTYIADGSFDPSSGATGFDTKFNRMNGYRIGAGVHVLAFAVNLEYQNAQFDDTEVQSYGSLAANSVSDLDLRTEGYSLNVSFPMEF